MKEKKQNGFTTCQLLEMDEVNRLISICNDLDHLSIIYKWFLDERVITDARNNICDLVNNIRDRFNI